MSSIEMNFIDAQEKAVAYARKADEQAIDTSEQSIRRLHAYAALSQAFSAIAANHHRNATVARLNR